ncbi:unnamed protein product [Ambrosiozyma monospora]|uniref:Unnamed protein product n=1 Tax=Ambrosiozyma monospora TaxID=43982 RepID=A0ACB5SYB0_AMBMO|nr:unnamed protein product [Ambrosiozyma monospora]
MAQLTRKRVRSRKAAANSESKSITTTRSRNRNSKSKSKSKSKTSTTTPSYSKTTTPTTQLQFQFRNDEYSENSKPREEQDFNEFYPNLNENVKLPLSIKRSSGSKTSSLSSSTTDATPTATVHVDIELYNEKLAEYQEKRQHRDSEIYLRLKTPSFRPIPTTEPTRESTKPNGTTTKPKSKGTATTTTTAIDASYSIHNDKSLEYQKRCQLHRTCIKLGFNEQQEQSTEHNHNYFTDVIPDDPVLPQVPFIRQDESRNGLATNTLANNAKFQVLYDMDEQDYLFLEWLNSDESVVPGPGSHTAVTNGSSSSSAANSSIVGTVNGSPTMTSEDANGSTLTSTPTSTAPASTSTPGPQSQARKHLLTMEVFEIIMTHLESQSYITSQLLPPPVKDQDQTNTIHRHHAELYSSDDGTGSIDQCCAVCNKTDCDSSTNAIIFCDGCNIAVHQECYGVQFIPEGPWLCRRCLISRNQTQKCLFCASTTGAFKQLDNGYWAHVICCLFINELYFANPTYMEPIEGLVNIPKSRWKLNCYICKQKVGACIQCHRSSCVTAYHVTCARRAGLYLGFKDGVAGALSDKSTLVSYCDKHCPKSWAHQHDIALGIEKTRLYFGLSDAERAALSSHDGCGASKVVVSKETKSLLRSTRNEMFKWKYSESAYNAPLIYIHRLSEFLRVNKIKIDHEFHTLCDIAKYWTMKRDMAKKPLIKRADALNYGLLTQDELKQRMQFTEIIKTDVGKVATLTNSIEQKTKLNTEITNCVIDQVEQLYFPKRSIFTFLSQQIFKNDAKLINATEPTPASTSTTTSSTTTTGKSKRIVSPEGHPILNLHTIYHKIEQMEYTRVSELINDMENLQKFMLDDPDTWRHTRAYRFFRGPWRNSRSKIYERCLKMEKLFDDGDFEKFVDEEMVLDGLSVELKENVAAAAVVDKSVEENVEEEAAVVESKELKDVVVSGESKVDQAADSEILSIEKNHDEREKDYEQTGNQVEDDGASSKMQIDESTKSHVVPGGEHNKESTTTDDKQVDTLESNEPVEPKPEPPLEDVSKEQTEPLIHPGENISTQAIQTQVSEPSTSVVTTQQQDDNYNPESKSNTKSPRKKRRRWMDQFVSQFFAQQKDDESGDVALAYDEDHNQETKSGCYNK